MNGVGWMLCAASSAVFCAGLTACEYALLRLRSTLSEELLADIRASKTVERRLAAAEPLLRAIHFGVFLGVGVFTVALGVLCAETAPWGWLMGALLYCLFYALCFVVPRKVGAAFPLRVVLAVGAPITAFRWLAWPLLRPFCALAASLERRWHLADVASLRVAADHMQKTSPTVRAILSNALDLHRLEISDIMLPRNRVVYLDIEAPLSEQLDCAKQSGHTRFPLVAHDLDHCIGLIHIKDIFRSSEGLTSLVRLRRDILRLPSNELLDNALTKMLRNKQHMGIVTDEFGGTAGIVTLDGIVEEIVGEIRDEFDTAPETFVTRVGEGVFRVSGLTPLHELRERFNRPFDSQTVSTLGGLVTETLERLPQKGETVFLKVPSVAVRVDETDGRRVMWTTLYLS